MTADSIFFGTELLEVCHGVCVAFKADMFVFAQIGVCLAHDHDDVGRCFHCGGDGGAHEIITRCFIIVCWGFQSHDVDLMEEGINQTTCVILIYLEIRVFHNRITVIQVFVSIDQCVQTKGCQYNADNANQTGNHRRTLFFAADEAENQYGNGSNEANSNECQHIDGKCLDDGQSFFDQCQVSGQQGFLPHGNFDFVADGKQNPYHLQQQGGKQQSSCHKIYQKHCKQCRQKVPQNHGRVCQKFIGNVQRMLGSDEKHQTHCHNGADQKRQNGFFPGKGCVLLLKTIEKHRQNLLMFYFFICA